MILPCNTAQGRYDIEIGRGILQQAGEQALADFLALLTQ